VLGELRKALATISFANGLLRCVSPKRSMDSRDENPTATIKKLVS
jgi:hypothetical protein